jgi:hypothetical protein
MTIAISGCFERAIFLSPSHLRRLISRGRTWLPASECSLGVTLMSGAESVPANRNSKNMNRFPQCPRLIVATLLLGLLVAVGCSRRVRPAYNAGPKPSPTATIARTPTPLPNPQIDRKTFSMTRPTGWTEDTKGEAYNPDSFVMFERGSGSNCLFEVIIVKKSAGASPDKLLASQTDGWLKIVSDAKVEQFDQWGSYRGQGSDIEGKVNAKYIQRHRVFNEGRNSNRRDTFDC